MNPLKTSLAKTLLLLTMMAPAVLGQMALADTLAEHKVVIQVSTDDARTQKIAMNNAVNLQKAYGMDNVDVQIVAYGPGLSMITKNSQYAERVASLAQQNVHFNACANTMAKIENKTGKKPALVDGVTVVSGGVKRITDLQEQGYAYIRP